MIRKDLKAVSIQYKDAAERFADFHSLRRAYASDLARGGVHPRVAMELMRHKNLELTLGTYTHTLHGDLAKALDALPAIPMIEPSPFLTLLRTALCFG
jgi:integrase